MVEYTMFLNWKTQFTKEISYPKVTCLFSETQIKTPVGNFFLGGGGPDSEMFKGMQITNINSLF